jgi:hypothetical protein
LWLGTVPTVTAATSTAPNPTVVFATPGNKQVSLQVCNVLGCTTSTQTVVVLDPAPSVISASATAVTAEVGQLVELIGTGRGRPPLTYTWQVLPPLAPIVNLPGATAWWDTTGYAPGVYTMKMSISNSAGTAVSPLSTVALLPAQGSDFYTVTPCRVYDSRDSTALTSGVQRTISVTACGIPADARAVAGNLTIISPTGPGVVSLFPGNYPVPGTSTVNFAAGATRANSVVMPMASDATGTLSLMASLSNSGTVQVVFDVSGYFRPSGL